MDQENQKQAFVESLKTVSGLSYSYQFDTKKSGKHVFISIAVHGNEIAGVVAFERFKNALETGKINLVQGKITFCLGNPEAFKKGTRFLHYNLNRAFEGGLNLDLYEVERAKEISNFLEKEKPDFILDLHSLSMGDSKMLIGSDSKSIKTALEISSINMLCIFSWQILPGPLISVSKILPSTQAIVVECGNHNKPETVETAFEHIISTLRYYHIISGDFTPKMHNNRYIYTAISIIKPEPGFEFTIPQKDLDTGFFISKGQQFAKSTTKQFIASQDCYLLMPAKNPDPKDSDAGFLALRELDF